MMYFALDDERQPFKGIKSTCSKCQHFVLGPVKDIWTEITKSTEKPAEATPSNDTYLNILKFLLYKMFKQKKCVTTEQLIAETHKASDAMTTMKNILFWSKDQLKILKPTEETKRVAFASEFGTGKTILLQAKARELLNIKDPKGKGTGKHFRKRAKEFPQSQIKQKVVIVIFEGTIEDTNLKLEYEKQFSSTGAKILGVQGHDGKH